MHVTVELTSQFFHSATDDQINRLLAQYQENLDSHDVVSAEIKRTKMV